jgi:SpoVK/Ycf46/Vps4 family AAA+-type ATPase
VYKANCDSVKLPIRTDNLPRTEFYPQLGDEPLTDYYDRFVASGSNVLVLIGPPGTGKTSFIRGLLHHTGGEALVSYDTAILESDEIFADFMSGDETFMVLEDADTFLSSRSKSGNTIMHRFLNLGDGLMSTGRKKIIFSTNLPSVRDIDDALLRPGRCFDVMRFGRLSADEARAIRPDYAGTTPLTLAELLGEGGNTSTANQPVGFA